MQNPSRKHDLWQHADSIAAVAQSKGALEPIDTQVQRHSEGGLSFTLHVISKFKKNASEQRAAPADPFLPHDPRLLVDEVGADHLLVLNKYPVLPRHLLLVTRTFVEQTAMLTREDFFAAQETLRRAPGLFFYNGGKTAGASQRHRHLQLIDECDDKDGPCLPLCRTLMALDATAPVQLADLPFAHAAMSFAGGDLAQQSQAMHQAYLQLLQACAVQIRDDGETGPYNLLFIDRAMMMVPRLCEHAAGLSINALGFAGQLLAASDDEAQILLDFGLVAALQRVAGKRADLDRVGDGGRKAR